jgi:hypothetical protein
MPRTSLRAGFLLGGLGLADTRQASQGDTFASTEFASQITIFEGGDMRSIVCALTVLTVLLGGCVATTPNQNQSVSEANRLTTGQVQLTLKKNETTQTEVLTTFGSPNLVTLNGDGDEVWTYQRHATVTSATSSSVYGTVILFGASSSASGLEQTSRTMTLIIKFREINGTKRVSDFQSRASSF